MDFATIHVALIRQQNPDGESGVSPIALCWHDMAVSIVAE